MKKIFLVMGLLGATIISIFCIYLFFIGKNDFLNEKDIFNDEFYFKELNENQIEYNQNNNLVVFNQLIIEAKDTTTKVNIKKKIKKYKGEIVGFIAATHTYQVEFNNNIKIDEIIKQFEKDEDIKHISYNYVFSMLDEYIEYPNDKEWKNEWSDIPDGYNWGLEAIKMPEAWDFVSKKSLNTVNIGVMETCGFQEDHVDLKENVHSSLGNYDQTDLSHGTQVCGIIAAEYNNKKGISGITKNKGKIDFFSYKGVNNPKYADLMTYKIGLIYLCDMAKQNNQTAVINLSLGLQNLMAYASYGSNEARKELNTYNAELESYLGCLLEKDYDFLLVKAAGNTNEKQYLKVNYNEEDKENTKYGYVPFSTNKESEEYKTYSYLYPDDDNELMSRLKSGNCDAQYDIFSGINSSRIKDRIIVVGAVENEGNNIFKLSESFSVCGSRVDILAPGKAIETLTDNDSICKGENFYGTSFSAPYVTGVAGLILSMEPTIPGDKLKKLIIQSGQGEYKTYITRFDDRSRDECNYTMLDALGALKLAKKYINNIDSYKLYSKKIKEYQNKYGNIREKYNENYYSLYLEGLCYANLIDFNNDNVDELIIVYFDKENKKYHYEIFGYEKNEIKLLESSIDSYKTLDNSNNSDFIDELFNYSTGLIYLKIYEYNNKYYVCTGGKQDDLDEKFHYYFHGFDNNGQFGICESIEVDNENQIMKFNGKQVSLDKIEAEIGKYTLYKDFYLSTYMYDYEQFPTRSEGSMLIMLNDINETMIKLDIDEKIIDNTEYRFFYGDWKDLTFEEIGDMPEWWNGTTIFNPDGTIYRKIWRQKEEGTYTVSEDGNVITAILTKQTTSAPLTDENSSHLLETDSFYLKIVYKKIDDKTMSVEYSQEDNTVQSSKIIHKEY